MFLHEARLSHLGAFGIGSSLAPCSEWRCLTYGATASPTGKAYMKFIQYPCEDYRNGVNARFRWDYQRRIVLAPWEEVRENE